jgi:hypothetical protein
LKIQFTPKVAYRMIERAKRTFINYPCATVKSEWKEILKDLQVFIVINPKLKTTAATAGFIKTPTARRSFKIPKEYPTTKVDGRNGYLIIEINPKYIVLDPAAEVYDTVSHELAHCLDYKIRGYYARTTASYHDEFWRKLHLRMGGTGIAYIDTASSLRMKLTKRKAKILAATFDPLDNKVG